MELQKQGNNFEKKNESELDLLLCNFAGQNEYQEIRHHILIRK